MSNQESIVLTLKYKKSDKIHQVISSIMVYVCVCVLLSQSLSHVQLFETLWTIACQALSMGKSGLPFPSLEDHPNQGLNLCVLYCRQILHHLSHQGSPQV